MIYMNGRPHQDYPFMTSWREASNLNNTTAPFAIDCGAFTGKFDIEKWIAHLHRYKHLSERCLFVVTPDVLFDAKATQAQFERYSLMIRTYGYRVAFVAQDGQTIEALPQDFDCLFIGGTNKFKYSSECLQLIKVAKAQGRWIHMGRVNSLSRIGYCKELGCDSVDGTHLSFSPKAHLPEILGWLAQSQLWEK